MSREVLITGGEGFVGRTLMRKYAGAAESFDLKSGSDINNPGQIEFAMQGKVAVAHLAAKISVRESHDQPELYRKVNVEGTKQVIAAAIKAGCAGILFFSSAAAKQPDNSPYGQTKWRAEQILQAYKDEIHVTIFRPENIYGPGQNPEYAGVITAFLNQAKSGQNLVVNGTGEQTRDFIWVEDIAALAKIALEHQAKIPSGTIFEVGTGTSTSVNTLAKHIASHYAVPVINKPGEDVGLMHSKADNRAILEVVGGYTFKTIQEGLNELMGEPVVTESLRR